MIRSSHRSKNRPIRLWPAVILVLLSLLLLIFIWSGEALNRQSQVIQTITLLTTVTGLLLLWTLLFSGISRRWKRGILGIFLGVLFLGVVLFRFSGVTGDLVPVLEWRWIQKQEWAEPRATEDDHLSETSDLVSQDYPQFLGPNRNATIPEVRLVRDWDSRPPKLIWHRPIGSGWSGFAVKDGLAITQEQQKGRASVVCLGLQTGELKWEESRIAGFTHVIAGDGPRATPTIYGDKVYTLGVTGVLNCIMLSSGALIWKRDISAEHSAPMPAYGFAGSPLVINGSVVVAAGGSNGRSLVAHDAQNGNYLWGGGSYPIAYSSPFLAEFGGVEQIVLFHESGISAHGLLSGKILWHHPWPNATEKVTQPVPIPESKLLVSSGYGIGSTLLHIKKNSEGNLRAEVAWKSISLKTKISQFVHHKGFVYGFDDGIMVCIDVNNGKRRWKGGRYGHGQVILAGDLLLVLTESGRVVLVDASPESHREFGKFQALEGKTWNTPALAGKYLLVRNNKEAACYELALE